MPISQMFAGLSARAEGIFNNFAKAISDTFSRTTSGSLGTADSGQVWTQTNGVWNSNGGTAVTSTTASNYPFATVPFKSNFTATLKSTSPGTGIVFWQTDANNWWAAATTSSTSYYTYTGLVGSCNSNSCCSGSNTCSSYSPTYGNNCCGYTCQASSNCGSTYYGPYFNFGTYSACCYRNIHNQCVASYSCGAGAVPAYYYAGYYSSCCTQTCNYNACCSGSNTCSYYSPTYGVDYCCSISYSYGTIGATQWNWTLNIFKSIAGTISNVANSILGTSTSQNTGATEKINAISVTASGNSVTATGYSDTSAITTIGSPVSATNSGAKGTGIGIISVPEGYSNGNSVGPFTAN